MIKEKVLKNLQQIVLEFKEKGKEFNTNKALVDTWLKKWHQVESEIKVMAPSDIQWMEEHYLKWAQENIPGDFSIESLLSTH